MHSPSQELAPELQGKLVSPVALRFQTIYMQESIFADDRSLANANKILERFPQAEVVRVAAHNHIPSVAGANPEQWMQTKQHALVLGKRSTLRHQKNGRSANYIAASPSNGCLSSCQYCYVARHKGGSNPLTVFVNIEEIIESIWRHQHRLGPKPEADQTDPRHWTYDIGCNSDLSLDALICDHPGRLVEAFADMEHARATFATKTVNDRFWLGYDPKGRTRIRYSIMPQAVARFVDIGTSPIVERIESINRLVAGGYEVHVNFSPIIVYGSGDEWFEPWIETWKQMDDLLTEQAKKQLACEAFFLTHSRNLHNLNLQWNARGEDFLWSPERQQPKPNRPDILAYTAQTRRRLIQQFRQGLEAKLPYCPIRYIF